MPRSFSSISKRIFPALVLNLFVVSVTAQKTYEPLSLVSTEHIANLAGDFNVFAVDTTHNRLFVSADKHGSLELFDLKTGKHLRSIGGVKEPHMLAYVATTNQLWVGDAGVSAIVMLDANDYHETGRIPLPTPPTAGLYDAKTGIFYIQDDGVDGKLPYSTINIIDVPSKTIIGTIRVEDPNLESMTVDHLSNRMYVNMRGTKRVAAIDLTKRAIVETWAIPGLNLNTPIAVDENTKRIFTAGRNPGKFYVIDGKTGSVIFESDCINIADYMIWDPAMNRIYITGSQGISIFHQVDANHYTKLAEFPTNGGKISTLVPSLQQLYVIHPKSDVDDAGLEVFHVNP